MRTINRVTRTLLSFIQSGAPFPFNLIVMVIAFSFASWVLFIPFLILVNIFGEAGTAIFFLLLLAIVAYYFYQRYFFRERARFITSLLPSLNDYRELIAQYNLDNVPDSDLKHTLEDHADFFSDLLYADAPPDLFADLHLDPNDTRAVLHQLPLRLEHFDTLTLEDFKSVFPTKINTRDIATKLSRDTQAELQKRGDTLIGEQYTTAPALQHAPLDQQITLSQDIRFRHLYVIGKTGSGKSVTLQNLIAQDLANPERGIILLSPEDGIFQKLLPYIPDNRKDDLIYYDPTDTRQPIIGFNCFDFHEAETLAPLEREELITQRAGELYTIFSRALGDLGVKMTTLMQNVAYALLQVPDTSILDIDRLLHPHNAKLRDIITTDERIDARTRQFWSDYDGVNASYYKSTYTTVINRLEPFFRPPLSLTFTTPAINFHDVLNKQRPRIIFLNVSKLRGMQAQIAGQLLIAEIQQSLQRRETIPEQKRTPYYFYVDEFALFASSQDAFIDLFARARKYRMACTVAHQTASDIAGQFLDILIGNVATLCVMQLSAGDAPYFAKELQLFEANEVRRRQVAEREASKLDTEARRIYRDTGRQVDMLADPYELMRLQAKIKDYAGASPSPAIIQNLPVGKAIVKTAGFNYGIPVSIPFFPDRPPTPELITHSKQNYGSARITHAATPMPPQPVTVNGSAALADFDDEEFEIG